MVKMNSFLAVDTISYGVIAIQNETWIMNLTLSNVQIFCSMDLYKLVQI